MYKYVTSAEVAIYRRSCSEVLTNLKKALCEEFDINTEFSLVGSGANNMVMRNGDGPFDLDYNLKILSMPEEYWDNLKRLKDTIRSQLNKVVGSELFSDGQDSKSVITSNLFLTNDRDRKSFSFDIAIIAELNNGNLARLIHNKRGFENFTWCEAPKSADIKAKVDALKREGFWQEVRDAYECKKNMYLTRNDYDHPSFVVYVEAVNEVYYNSLR
jgi:hypothetical protein